jgi:hypothetical protein
LRKIKNYRQISLTDEESVLLKNKNNLDFSRVPLQFRALVLSNYGLSRFSFALQDDQLLENPKFSTAINNVFNRVRVAQYLDGFEKKQNGLRILNNPIYKTLDQEAIDSGKTLMIKMSSFNLDLLQIEGEDQIPATNCFFAIEGSLELSLDNVLEGDEIRVSDREQKEFSTTNIVKQNKKRQELTSFDAATVLETVDITPSVNPRSSIRPTRSGRATSEDRRTRNRTAATRTSAPRGSSGGSSGGGY